MVALILGNPIWACSGRDLMSPALSESDFFDPIGSALAAVRLLENLFILLRVQRMLNVSVTSGSAYLGVDDRNKPRPE